MAIVIAVYNQKGGIGKTFSTINLSADLALKGYKVVAIDGDPQCNLTQFFFEENEKVFSNGALKEEYCNLYNVLEEDLNIYNSILTCSYETKRKVRNHFKKKSCSLDIIPGSVDLNYIQLDNMNLFADKIKQISDEYDFILIDFPPAKNRITMSYLLACDYILVPMHLAKNSSMYGYQYVMDSCREAAEYGNKKLQLLGLFYNYTQLHKGDQKALYDNCMLDEIRIPLKLFRSTISYHYSSVQESESLHRPLCMCSKSNTANDFTSLTEEIIKRIEEEKIYGQKDIG